MRKIALAAVIATGAALPQAHANEFEPALRKFVESQVSEWIASPAIVEAIKAQNEKHAGLGQGDIDSLDQQWRAEVGASTTPLIDSVLRTPASSFLRDQLFASDGLITEIFLMDDKGLNVAASDITSDYWQGDEAKWQKTYSAGANAVHFGDVELDESTQQHQSQVSVSIIDPATGETIGAATIGVNVEYLQ